MNIQECIAKGDFTVVDVRTPAEFMGGHVAESINIPLNDVPAQLNELKSMKQPIVLCCASGHRSGQAENLLSNQGITCINGGSWFDVNHFLHQHD